MKAPEKERRGIRESLEELDTAFAALCQEIQNYGRVDLVEICCPADSALARSVLDRGGTAFRMGLWNDFDFSKNAIHEVPRRSIPRRSTSQGCHPGRLGVHPEAPSPAG